jgi:hypothetical protein
MAEKGVALLIGLLAALLLSCGCGALYLLAAPTPQVTEQGELVDAYVRADVSEAYLNRSFTANAAMAPSPWPIHSGQVDVLPGNRLNFAATAQSPVGRITFTGTVAITARDGQLHIGIASVNLGPLPVTPFLRAFYPGIEGRINAEANRLLLERASGAHLRLATVTTSDTHLHLFLAGRE